MARVKRAVHAKKHHRAVLEQAQGYYGNKSRSFRAANEQVMHSMQYAYRDRRARKGDFRQLWIQRINAAARLNGTSYSRFIAGLHRADVEVDRKVLADLAVTEPEAFASLVQVANDALATAPAMPRPVPDPDRARLHPSPGPSGPAAPPQAEPAEHPRGRWWWKGPSCCRWPLDAGVRRRVGVRRPRGAGQPGCGRRGR